MPKKKVKFKKIKVKKGFDIVDQGGSDKPEICIMSGDKRLIRNCKDVQEAERFIDFIKRD